MATTTTTTATNGNPYQSATSYTSPSYITQPSADVSGFIQDYYASMTNPQSGVLGGYQGQLTAGIDPLQQQALNQVPNAVGAWGTQFNQGIGNLGSAYSRMARTGTYNPAAMQQHLNPYLGGVLDEISRRGNENLTENVLPGINSTFTGNGQFGSTRNADFTQRAMRNNQREISGAQGNAMNQAYNQAATDYSNWNSADQAAANGMGTLGQQQIQSALSGGTQNWNDISNAFNMGGQNRTIAQQGLTDQYNNWQNTWKQPVDLMSSLGGILSQLKSGVNQNSQTANATSSDPNAALYAMLGQLLSGVGGTAAAGV